MSCESWSELLAHGERLLWEGSPERQAAERHFRSCPSCAERAFLLDPSWSVRRWTRSSESRSLEDSSYRSSEIAELKGKILEAGRMREFEGSVRRAPVSIRAAAAAALLAVLLAGGALLRTSGGAWQAKDDGNSEASVRGSGSTLPVAVRDSLFSAAAVELSLPAVGFLAPAAARVYDLGQEDFALVMVVHETLDL